MFKNFGEKDIKIQIIPNNINKYKFTIPIKKNSEEAKIVDK